MDRLRGASRFLGLALPDALLQHSQRPLLQAGGLTDVYSVAEATLFSTSGFRGCIQQLDGPASSTSSAESTDDPQTSGGARSSNRLRLVLEDIRCDVGALWRRGTSALSLLREAMRNTAWVRLQSTPTREESLRQEALDIETLSIFEQEFSASFTSQPSRGDSPGSSTSNARCPASPASVEVNYPHPNTIEPHEAGWLLCNI